MAVGLVCFGPSPVDAGKVCNNLTVNDVLFSAIS